MSECSWSTINRRTGPARSPTSLPPPFPDASKFCTERIGGGWAVRLHARDCTSGYRCWRREALAKMPLERFMSDGYSFLTEMLYVAAQQGCRITEVPITFVERRQGESKLSRQVLVESALTPDCARQAAISPLYAMV